MEKIEHKELLKIGFVDETSSFNVKRASLNISGEYFKLVYSESIPYIALDIGGNKMPLHNIKTIDKVKELIEILK